MSILLPIVFWMVAVGLFARRLTANLWWATAAYIVVVLAYYWISNP